MGKKHRNGEGSIYERQDGRWCAQVYVIAMTGRRKRVSVYGKTYQEARDKLDALQERTRKHLPVAGQKLRLDAYLDYWLKESVAIDKKPKTYDQYESAVRLYLKPGLGNQYLEDLTVPWTQAFFNEMREQGKSVRQLQIVRTTLSAALTNAMREEYIVRNVARLVRLPQWVPKPVYPWSPEEATRFLTATRSHRLYPAFLLLVLCGMRQGEVLGLRWQDIDFEHDTIQIRQQLQTVRAKLIVSTVKTKAGERVLPLLPQVKAALLTYRAADGPTPDAMAVQHDLVFISRAGTPIAARNFVRTFEEICAANNVRAITMHHVRHTTATMLKNNGVPARDTQLILGHASPWTTTQIYQHDDLDRRREHIQQLGSMLILSTDDDDRGESVFSGVVPVR